MSDKKVLWKIYRGISTEDLQLVQAINFNWPCPLNSEDKNLTYYGSCNGCNCGKAVDRDTYNKFENKADIKESDVAALNEKPITDVMLTACKQKFKHSAFNGTTAKDPENWEFCYMQKSQICSGSLCCETVFIKDPELIKLIKKLDAEADTIRTNVSNDQDRKNLIEKREYINKLIVLYSNVSSDFKSLASYTESGDRDCLGIWKERCDQSLAEIQAVLPWFKMNVKS